VILACLPLGPSFPACVSNEAVRIRRLVFGLWLGVSVEYIESRAKKAFHGGR
jgi:hypothetical protein